MKIVRYIFVLCLLSLVLCPAKAQPRLFQPEYWVGAHGGATASLVFFRPQAEGMTPITNACVLGADAGLVFRFAGHKYCHFQMELNYLHRGWASYTESTGHVYRNLHYVEVPILMNLNFGSDKCRWFFNLGPQIGYCVKDESNSITQPFDWGLAAGTGVYFRTKKAGIYEIEIRYDFSFGGVVGTGVKDKYNMANPMDLSINLGWYMPIKKKLKGVPDLKYSNYTYEN